jgi:3-hydroxyacyl-[acyl-carrier-protein] dehydratase
VSRARSLVGLMINPTSARVSSSMPPLNGALGRLLPFATARTSPWSRVRMDTVWLVSDQSHWRTQMAWSCAADTLKGTRGQASAEGGTGPRHLRSAVHFDLLDQVLERSVERIVTLKSVSRAEEYLQDHFATFPVLPGVFMIESMVHAARRLVQDKVPQTRLVLGGVRAVKYGRFVRPGEGLVVEVKLVKREGDLFEFKGEGTVRGVDGQIVPDVTAVSGRFSLRPVKIA